MKYAQKTTQEFKDDDGDTIVAKSQPTGSQYDERMALLGNMRIPGNLINENTNMEELFANGEMVEISMDKRALAEFQFKALFVSMTIGGKTYASISEAVGQYRQFDRETKEWIDSNFDSIWKAHEKDVKAIVSAEGESEGLPANSSKGKA
jgi:hypothetical protein